ncbi:MAG TPA: RDD family protein [Thermoanaerobaculia bacterium]|nr:RDD family protein [Thermoanaerobaculia bacterium]
MTDSSQTKLLRIAAFLVDALSIAIILVVPASAASYAMTWASSPKGIQLVWWGALAVLMFAMLLRDGWRGRASAGKQLLGLRLLTPQGEGCGYGRSVVRNFPLIVPGWNVVEVILVLAGKRRTGDRLARTNVTEE